MSNEEIMEAREDILANKDDYAQWAVKNIVLKPEEVDAFWTYFALKQRNDLLRAKGQPVPEEDATKEWEGDQKFGEVHDKLVEERQNHLARDRELSGGEENVLFVQKNDGTERDNLNEMIAGGISVKGDFGVASEGQDDLATVNPPPQVAMTDNGLKQIFTLAGQGDGLDIETPCQQSRTGDQPEAPLPDTGASNLGF